MLDEANVAEGLSETIQWHELPEALAQGKILLDVRNEGELQNGAFKDALNIPLNDLRLSIGGIRP